MIGFNLSVSDLLLVDGFKESFGQDNKEKIKEILFNNGMDVNKEFELVFCRHRNLRGMVVECQRYEGEERFDRDWLKSGAASWEAQLEACDPQTRIDLRVMGNRASPTEAAMRHAKNDKPDI